MDASRDMLDFVLDATEGRAQSFPTVEYQSSRAWPGAVATQPKHVCDHPNRHEFYCWRSPDAARYERDLMARNPHYARLYVSEVYAGALGGWAWAVCWSCPRAEN